MKIETNSWHTESKQITAWDSNNKIWKTWQLVENLMVANAPRVCLNIWREKIMERKIHTLTQPKNNNTEAQEKKSGLWLNERTEPNERNGNVYINQSEIYIKCSLGRLLFHLRIASYARFSSSIRISRLFFRALPFLLLLRCSIRLIFSSILFHLWAYSFYTRDTMYRYDTIWLCNANYVLCTLVNADDVGKIGRVFCCCSDSFCSFPISILIHVYSCLCIFIYL